VTTKLAFFLSQVEDKSFFSSSELHKGSHIENENMSYHLTHEEITNSKSLKVIRYHGVDTLYDIGRPCFIVSTNAF
jgi:hypothetical protein